MSSVGLSSPMDMCVPDPTVVTEYSPPFMETDCGDTYTVADLSRCAVEPEEQPVSNGWSNHNDLFAELDYEMPTTSGANADGFTVAFSEKETTQEDYDMYKYYYMLEDSHEDVLKRLEYEIEREEVEEQKKAEELEARMKELEKGAEEFDHVQLEAQRIMQAKRKEERKAEKKRIIEIRKELARANREREIFCCFVCSKVFMDEEKMREHVTEKHLAFKKEYKLKCSKCYRRFSKKQHLMRHEQAHLNKGFTCNLCNRDFKEEVSLRIHMSRVHGMSMEGAKIAREHKCGCGKKFGIIEELKRHRYYCESRETIAERRRKARQELDAMSSVTFGSSPPQSVISSCSESTSAVSIGSASGRPVKDKSCPFCFLVCASMQSRRRHIERKHPEKLASEEVDQHSYIKMQSAALPYACEQCSKTFASRGSLSTHKKRTHEDKRDHECSSCGKRYPLPSELKKHLKRVHKIIDIPW